MPLIGLSGIKRSGKDTFADILVEKYGFEKKSFADPLKEMCRALFNFNDEQLYGDLKEVVDERWNITPREALQNLGTDFVRKNLKIYLPNLQCPKDEFWLKRFSLWYQDNKDKNVVVPDIRFENEALLIRQLGGTVIRVKSVKDVYNKDSHSSENNFDNIKSDINIFNDYTPNYFVKIEDVLSQVLK
jgi:hypothetical protein